MGAWSSCLLFELFFMMQPFYYKMQLQMGQCISSQNTSKRRNDQGDRYDAEPTDTPSLNAADFPQLEFSTFLTKLKLKRCNFYRQLGIRIEFGGYEEFELKPKFLLNETARWEIEHLLEFKVTEYEMRKKFLVLSILQEQNRVIGSLKINLYHLATGPYHQDFALPLPKASGTRLSFNLKIAQRVKMRLKFNEVEMIPKDREFPGDMFAFCLRTIIGDRIEQTNTSYRYVIAFETDTIGAAKPALEKYHSAIDKLQKRTSYTDKSAKASADRPVSSSFRRSSTLNPYFNNLGVEMTARDIFWSSKISNQMPQIQAYVPLYDLHCASFNIIFYSFTLKGRQFSSQCFISYNKLTNFPCQDRLDQASLIKWQQREIDIEVKTYDHGKQTGKAVFNLKFEIQKFIKQMQVCVRTENGILQSSPVFGQSGSSSKIPQQLEELEKLGNEIQNIFIEASRSNANKAKPQVQSERYMEEVNKRLKRQREILMSSAKQSKLMFVYQDERALLKGQRGLIELGFRTRALLNEDRQQIAPNCWELLIALMKRGQLTLAYIGYTTAQVQESLQGKSSEFLKRKKEVSLTYHSLMVDLLHSTLQALQTYNYENQKQFAELFCAYAYFRIPRFRSQVLGAITRSNDPEIEEWRGTQFSLTDDHTQQLQSEGQTAFSLMFDWENHFYKMLDRQEEYSKTESKLSQLLRNSDWEARMRKRGGAFFAFVRYWVNYVESIAINSKHVSWRYFPGYNKILLSFLAQMKARSVQDYSQAMRRAAASLLSNEKLLNPFVLILFRKTNTNDQIAVLRAFDLLNLFFSSITSRARSLPSTFDLKLLLRGIKSVLEGQSAFGIGKVMLVIYDHYKIFPVEFRIEIALYLMTKVFFKIFLHWSPNVRAIFHHLFFIRIYHQASRPINQLDPKDQEIYRSNPQYRTEILSRYRKLIVILENAQQFEHKIRTSKIDVYQKEAHRRLKRKILEKRKQISNPQNIPAKRKFSDENEYRVQLMTELSQPKLERYNSEVLSRNLKVAVESTKSVKKEEIIMKRSKAKEEDETNFKKRKLSFFENSLESELVPLKEEEVIYVRQSLEEFHKINEMFIQHIERNKESVPVVKLELSLDEKELRPQGLSEHEEW